MVEFKCPSCEVVVTDQWVSNIKNDDIIRCPSCGSGIRVRLIKRDIADLRKVATNFGNSDAYDVLRQLCAACGIESVSAVITELATIEDRLLNGEFLNVLRMDDEV